MRCVVRDKQGDIAKLSRFASWFDYKTEWFHHGGLLYHVTGGDHPGAENPALDLRPLRTCRLMYMETALLPYRLNKFFFPDQKARKRFEKSARVGKKRAQKAAVGKYEIMDRAEFESKERGKD